MTKIDNDTSNDVIGEICCLQCIYPNAQNTQEIDNCMIYKTTSDPDTMYLYQAMQEPDKQFH